MLLPVAYSQQAVGRWFEGLRQICEKRCARSVLFSSGVIMTQDQIAVQLNKLKTNEEEQYTFKHK